MIRIFIITGVAILVSVGFLLIRKSRDFKLPKGETTQLPAISQTEESPEKKIFITDRIKHSIPLDEILAGGPSKDGIPSIDNPKFLSVQKGDGFLANEESGTGLCVGDDCRFYPYLVLVWHEIVNDTVGDEPMLVTYCPLCLTGIVFERKINGKTVEFGTSGKLWRSNLLMYNRTNDPKKESLWSQVLGEAVVGEFTGTKLKIIPSDIIKYGDWKTLHPKTKILSKETSFIRSYGFDPYGDYYTSNQISFGASFNDDRLHPKEFVLGIEVSGKFKAYHSKALVVGETVDSFNGEKIIIRKNKEGEIRMFKGPREEPLPFIGGFWFSWLSVHPETDLYK